MEEKPYNEVGEICINSPSIMIGYLNNPEETSQALKVHEDGRVWMHTGDLGYVDDKGNVFIQGRLKRIYLTEYHGAPSKIFPDRIEQTLMRHSVLSECGVICVSEVENIYKPIAFCVLKDEHKTEIVKTERELRMLCKEELPEYDLPIRYYFLDSIPHSGHGKVDYRTLEVMAKEDKSHA